MTPSSTDLFNQQPGRAVLLSLLPKYAEKIATGTKRVEFRRSWTPEPVSVLALYATSPISRLIGVTSVRAVVQGSPTALWSLSQKYGGGVSRRELYEYLKGKKNGFALLLGDAEVFKPPINLKQQTNDFRAPQSFRFLLPEEFRQMTKAVKKRRAIG